MKTGEGLLKIWATDSSLLETRYVLRILGVSGIANDSDSDSQNEIDAVTSVNSWMKMSPLVIPNKLTRKNWNFTKNQSILNIVTMQIYYVASITLQKILRYVRKYCELCQHFQQTTNYVLFRKCSHPQVSVEKLRVFIFILIETWYNVLHSRSSYW